MRRLNRVTLLSRKRLGDAKLNVDKSALGGRKRNRLRADSIPVRTSRSERKMDSTGEWIGDANTLRISLEKQDKTNERSKWVKSKEKEKERGPDLTERQEKRALQARSITNDWELFERVDLGRKKRRKSKQRMKRRSRKKVPENEDILFRFSVQIWRTGTVGRNCLVSCCSFVSSILTSSFLPALLFFFPSHDGIRERARRITEAKKTLHCFSFSSSALSIDEFTSNVYLFFSFPSSFCFLLLLFLPSRTITGHAAVNCSSFSSDSLRTVARKTWNVEIVREHGDVSLSLSFLPSFLFLSFFRFNAFLSFPLRYRFLGLFVQQLRFRFRKGDATVASVTFWASGKVFWLTDYLLACCFVFVLTAVILCLFLVPPHSVSFSSSAFCFFFYFLRIYSFSREVGCHGRTNWTDRN